MSINILITCTLALGGVNGEETDGAQTTVWREGE